MANIKEIKIPDIGDFKDVPIVEIFVSAGDVLNKDDPVLAIESDKAVMEIPTPFAGKIAGIEKKVGDTVSEDDVIATIEAVGAEAGEGSAVVKEEENETAAPTEKSEKHEEQVLQETAPFSKSGNFHASPSIRLLARELEIDLSNVSATGPKGRIRREDLYKYIKSRMSSSGNAVFSVNPEEFKEYGPIEIIDINKIKQISSRRLKLSWQVIPHVTHMETADITDLEAYRKKLNRKYAKKNIRLSILPFIIKAVSKALKKFPLFNSSFMESGNQIIYKKYYNIGCAVDTGNGLLVPVIRNADQKSVLEITEEITDMAEKARNKRLQTDKLSGGTFTVSSLGGIGGANFTPIINPPESAILGVSRAETIPVWNKEIGNFEPRIILPFSVSYDHRIIDGAEGARFCRFLSEMLNDMRNVLL